MCFFGVDFFKVVSCVVLKLRFEKIVIGFDESDFEN